MGRCRCGAALVPDLHFCVACGARQDLGRRVPVAVGAARLAAPAPLYAAPRPSYYPAPPPGPASRPAVGPASARSTVPWIVAGVSVVVAVVLVAVGVLAARPAAVFGTPAPTPVVVPTVTVGVPVPAAASSESDSTGSRSTGSGSTSSGSTGGSAAAGLAAQVASDRSTVDGLVGQWVPQLSAKRDGLVADGITYDDDAILTHWSTLTGRDPSAVMLYSGDWPVFNGSDFWVVVHPQGFSTAAAANAWCAAQGYAADDCYAKKLSHSGGPAGTTVTRH
jgi:hypothetical protein